MNIHSPADVQIEVSRPPKSLSRLSRLWRSGAFAPLLMLLLAGSAGASNGKIVQTMPPEPVLQPKIHGVQLNAGAYEYTDSYLPLMSNTRDYRLGVSRKLYVNNGVREVRFFLLKPETLDDQPLSRRELATSPPGAAHWIDSFDMHADNLTPNPSFIAAADDFHTHPDDDFGHMHFAICDSTVGYDGHGASPYACEPGLDCYEFDLMLGLSIDHTQAHPNTSNAPETQLFSTRVRVKIEKPKSADAAIRSVEIVDKDGDGDRSDETIAGPRFAGTTSHGINSFHTPLIVGKDNRLLFARIGGNSVPEYTDELGKLITSGKQDMVYSVNTSADQCDVTGWNELRPISFATLDSDVQEFGFAQNPFSTPSGHQIEPHERIYGNYLWVDQEADNLFFSTLKRPLLESQIDPNLPLYAYTCFDGGSDCQTDERISGHQGWTMAGLWTHGKMVLLDSLVNNMDFGIRAAEKKHAMVELYSDKDVRIGTGEEVTVIAGGSEPSGWGRTTVQFGSAEHFLNMAEGLKPRTPRDVVWHISAGARSDEFAFDDLISHRTLIFSPMNALKESEPGQGGDRTYYDGNQAETINGQRPMRLQNVATSQTYQYPPYGEVIAASGEGRIENVALGGIKARGFYLYPQSRIRYSIANQDLTLRDWLISLFIDRRDSSSNRSRLVTLPSGASIALNGNTHARICDDSGLSCSDLLLPIPVPTKAWTHLAFVIDDSADKVQAYQNGFLFAEIDRPTGFAVTPGELELGKGGLSADAGFEGWIDEFKVIEGPFNVEEVCNHARGTLVSMPHHYQGDLSNRFALLEIPFHQSELKPFGISGREAVQDALHDGSAFAWSLSDYFVCNVDYTTHLGISVNDPGQPKNLGDPRDLEVRPLRRRLLFEEGPLVFDQPRPTSLNNNFCLSCHGGNRAKGLHTDALIAEPENALDDLRRMPMQAPRELIGMVPAHYFGPDRPAVETEFTDLQPLLSDRWIDNGPLYRWKFDSATGSQLHNWVGGDIESGHDGDGSFTSGTARRPGMGRAHSLEFDGSGGHARIATNAAGDEPDIHGEALTLASWMLLDPPTLGVEGDQAEDQCQAFTSEAPTDPVKPPCTLIAKSGNNTHDITWGLRVLHKISGWWVQMHVTNSAGIIANRSQLLPLVTTTSWSHLAAVYDDGSVEFFLNGTSLGPAQTIHDPLQTTSSLSTDASEPISIGAKLKSGVTPIHPFHGRLDEVHIFDRALADWEIAALVIETP